jgi:hypothetical protein
MTGIPFHIVVLIYNVFDAGIFGEKLQQGGGLTQPARREFSYLDDLRFWKKFSGLDSDRMNRLP